MFCSRYLVSKLSAIFYQYVTVCAQYSKEISFSLLMPERIAAGRIQKMQCKISVCLLMHAAGEGVCDLAG